MYYYLFSVKYEPKMRHNFGRKVFFLHDMLKATVLKIYKLENISTERFDAFIEKKKSPTCLFCKSLPPLPRITFFAISQLIIKITEQLRCLNIGLQGQISQ